VGKRISEAPEVMDFKNMASEMGFLQMVWDSYGT